MALLARAMPAAGADGGLAGQSIRAGNHATQAVGRVPAAGES
jgi:hypothetical protein